MKKRSLLKTLQKNKVNYAFIAPYFILFITFTVLPVLASVALSFTYYDVLSPARFAGFSNYFTLVFEDDVFITALTNTLVMAVLTGPLGYILSFVLAWMINDLGKTLRVIFVFFIYTPSISGNMYMVWKLIFSDDANGILNSLLMYFGWIDSSIYWLTDTKYMMTIVVIVQLWMSMGVGFLSFVAGLQGVDDSLLEAGSIDGIRNRWQELWYVILPSMRPQLLFGAVTSISSAFSIGDVTANLCGMPSTDYAVHTILNHLNDYGGTRMELGYASAIATVLFFMMVISKNLFTKMLNRIGR
ncbi:MAG: sugar ABC transporter permease [Acutalibacteraceae bacterium]|nr:sugar ABC transporter permease [Acutalibacteraceae bacterium]